MIRRPLTLLHSALLLLPLVALSNCGTPSEGDGGASVDCADHGLATCGTSCVDTQTDAVNCGQCGVTCGAGQVCASGACACAQALQDCGGVCADVLGSGTNCGTCGNVCGAGTVCSNGTCETGCPIGQIACGTSCVTTSSDIQNCGACGVVCTGNESCTNGSCVDNTATGGASGVGGTATGGATETGGAVATGGVVSSGGTVASGGTSGSGTDVQINGTCYPLCESAASDPDGDGWGWENAASCVVVDSNPYDGGTPCDAGGTGGAATGGTGGTATGGAGSTTCGVAPVNANASPQAKKLLCYLYDIYGKNVLSGQQETSWSNPQNDISWYDTNTGKYPALLGGDYLYPNGTSNRAISYFNAGGIVMIRYHMGAPPNSDTYENSMGTANIGNVLTQGTAEYNSFITKLNYVGDELQKLEDANVAVLWAPFHEVQPNGWFWWSKGTAQQFKQLWTMMFNHLTTTRGLNNLVWLMPFSGSPSAAWLPEKNYYDISGPDTYATNPPFASMFDTAKGIIGSTVPIPLHETGVVPQPSSMFPSTAPWVLWNIWAGYQISNNSLSNIQSAYSSPYTITRDEVPNLK